MLLRLFLLLVFITAQIQAQCPSKEFVDNNSKGLKCDIVQTIEINILSKKDVTDEEKDLKLFLTKGLTYEFMIFDGEDHNEELVLSLFDAKDNRLACTFNDVSGMRSKKIKFLCKTSGDYTLSYYPRKKKYCGMILIGTAKKK